MTIRPQSAGLISLVCGMVQEAYEWLDGKEDEYDDADYRMSFVKLRAVS
jgi:hypothetical protein